jgi:hypothetical protein
MSVSSIAPIPRPTRTDSFINAVLSQTAGAVRSRRRVALLVLTVALGASAGVAVALLGRSAERTFVAVQGSTQLSISVLLPLVGILLAVDLRRSGETQTLPTCLAAGAIAVRVSIAGLLVAVVATSVAPGTTPGRWQGAASLAAGGVVVEVVCMLFGVGLGLLITRPWVAFLASAVVPMGLYGTIGAVTPLRAARDWVTPYASAQHLLSGATTPLIWAQAVVVLFLWGFALPALATSWLRRRSAE